MHWYQISTLYQPIHNFGYQNCYQKGKNGIRTSLIKSPSSHCSLCVLTDKTDILIKTLGYFHPMFVVKNTSFKAKT